VKRRKPDGSVAAGLASAWLGAPKREEQAAGERKARRRAREQAEREHFGPAGRPRSVGGDTQDINKEG
jgi:hypothetical protein